MMVETLTEEGAYSHVINILTKQHHVRMAVIRKRVLEGIPTGKPAVEATFGVMGRPWDPTWVEEIHALPGLEAGPHGTGAGTARMPEGIHKGARAASALWHQRVDQYRARSEILYKILGKRIWGLRGSVGSSQTMNKKQ